MIPAFLRRHDRGMSGTIVSAVEPVRMRARQPRLFSLLDPLTERFGPEYFRSLPAQPGVYFFHGSQGELLYIGQSADLKARIGSYRHVTPETNPKRTLRLVHRIARIEWRTCTTANEAVELERVLLLEHRPPFNRAGVWQGEPWWLTVEARDGRMHLELRKEENGIGPLPPAFRYVLASMARCMYRAAFPALPISQYPHGMFAPSVPLSFSLTLPEVDEAIEIITAYAKGDPVALLKRLEVLPPVVSAAEQEYWDEEIERLKKYAARAEKTHAAGSLKAATIPA